MNSQAKGRSSQAAGPVSRFPAQNFGAPKSSLVLLGTVHSDPRGFSRARAFLEQYGPDLILVEISPFALKYRKERSAELKKLFVERLGAVSQKMNIELNAVVKHAQIASILRQIGLPYEYRASAAYAKRTGIDLVAVDCSEFSREWIQTWREMISAENIERLLEMENARPPTRFFYARAAQGVAGGCALPVPEPADSLRWQERENHMAREIASALARLSPLKPVYIGGWWHLCRGGSVKTIRDLLGIEAASCLLLNGAGGGAAEGRCTGRMPW